MSASSFEWRPQSGAFGGSGSIPVRAEINNEVVAKSIDFVTIDLLIPVLGLAYPVLRLAPTLYVWNVQRRILRLYRELEVIEAELISQARDGTPDAFVRLRRLEERANRLRLPVSFAPVLYTLRSHIALIENRVARSAAPRTSESAGSVRPPRESHGG